jgi:hypothetical protein
VATQSTSSPPNKLIRRGDYLYARIPHTSFIAEDLEQCGNGVNQRAGGGIEMNRAPLSNNVTKCSEIQREDGELDSSEVIDVTTNGEPAEKNRGTSAVQHRVAATVSSRNGTQASQTTMKNSQASQATVKSSQATQPAAKSSQANHGDETGIGVDEYGCVKM